MARNKKKGGREMTYMAIQEAIGARNGMSLRKACTLAEVSRSAYYDRTVTGGNNTSLDLYEMELRDEIQKIAVDFPRYGYRRMTEELRRQGYMVNRKRVLRLMREDNLLCVKRRFKPVTTDSNHDLMVYPNLAKEMEVTGLNQLWVADITYIRLQTEFIYLAVILDVFSRRCIGWELGRTLEAILTLRALRMALKNRKGVDLSKLVHHSDRGVQYASKEYVELLEAHGIKISMSR
ncbi:MAG: IS3 family transposase, partial [Thermoplasmata archaeon]